MIAPPTHLEQQIGKARVARLATLSDSGYPHQVPVVFVYQDALFWSPVDGKPKRGSRLQRLRNVEQNQHGSLIIDHYDEDWSQLWWIRVEVDLAVIELDGLDKKARLQAETVVLALEEKYPQYRETAVLSGSPTMLMMRPRRFVTWSASPDPADGI